MTLAAWGTVLGLVLVGSTGSGGLVYWLLNRKTQQIQDDRTVADRDKLKADRESTLADAALKWQELLDESSTKAYEKLERQCSACIDKLTGMESIADNLIDALESLLESDTPQSRANARASVRLARRARSHH